MQAAEVKCNKLNKINILHRASLRGLKKCQSCGAISGQRSIICRNDNCDLRKRMLAAIKPFDPIQLITRNDIRLFSLKTRDKNTNVRNFVRITADTTKVTDVPFATQSNGRVGSSTAECYVDSCKYDPSSMAATGCRHVKACTVPNDVPQAEVYPLDVNVLWNLNITETQKQQLWELYENDQQNVQPVQRLDASTFVVACDKTKNFTSGRLHVTVFANSIANKNGFYSCACKKLKIVVEADNSVIMKKEICDHIILVLAAILSKTEGKTLYGDFLESLQHLWMPNSLNLPVDSTSDTMEFDMPLIKCEEFLPETEVTKTKNSQDVFSFSEEIFTENVSM